MASLDNFHTQQGSVVQLSFINLQDRMRLIQQGIHSSQDSAWDIANAVPIGPTQPHDPGNRAASKNVDPQYVERISHRGLKDQYIPLRPHTSRLLGDTAEGVLLYDTPHHSFGLRQRFAQLFGRTMTPVRTVDRYQPYRRTFNQAK